MEFGITFKLNRKSSKPGNQQDLPMEKRTSLSNPSNWLVDAWSGMTGWLGGSVGSTDESAMRLAAVYSCVRLISENMAAFPIDLIQKTDDGRIVNVSHPSIRLFKGRPNPTMTKYRWFELMMGQSLMKGDGISLIKRNSSGFPVSLKYYKTSDVKVAIVDDVPYYKFIDIDEPVSGDDVIHIMAFGDSPNKGISPIRQHAQTIGTGLKAQNYNAKFYENGGWLKGWLKFPGKLDAGRPKELGAEWDEQYSGDNAFKTMVLHSGAEFNSANISHRDSQYIENMKFTREEIAGIFNVNPGMIGDTEKMNFAVLEQTDIHFAKYTLRPWIKRFEEELNAKLLTSDERANGYGFKFNVNALLRGDVKTRSEFYTKMISHGVMSPNDVRSLENMNPREGGDNYFNQVNTQTQKQFELAEQKTELEIEKMKIQDNE